MERELIRLSDDLTSGVLTECENGHVTARQQKSIRGRKIGPQERESLTVSFPVTLLKEFTEIVSLRGIPKASVVRMLVKEYVRDNRWILSKRVKKEEPAEDEK